MYVSYACNVTQTVYFTCMTGPSGVESLTTVVGALYRPSRPHHNHHLVSVYLANLLHQMYCGHVKGLQQVDTWLSSHTQVSKSTWPIPLTMRTRIRFMCTLYIFWDMVNVELWCNMPERIKVDKIVKFYISIIIFICMILQKYGRQIE